mgnify:CR=1 FL=1
MLVQKTFKNQLEEVEATEGKKNEKKVEKSQNAPKSTDDERQIHCGSLVAVTCLSHPKIS